MSMTEGAAEYIHYKHVSQTEDMCKRILLQAACQGILVLKHMGRV